jgi:hypothetical protein
MRYEHATKSKPGIHPTSRLALRALLVILSNGPLFECFFLFVAIVNIQFDSVARDRPQYYTVHFKIPYLQSFHLVSS